MNICPRCNEPTYTLDDAKYHRDCAEEEIDRLTAELAICRDAVKKHKLVLFDENEKVVKLRSELAANAAMLARQTDLAREAEIQLAEATKAVEGRDKTLIASGQSIQYLERELEQASNAKLEKVIEENKTLKALRDELFDRLNTAEDTLKRVRHKIRSAGEEIWEAGTLNCMIGGDDYFRKRALQHIQNALYILQEAILTEPEGGQNDTL